MATLSATLSVANQGQYSLPEYRPRLFDQIKVVFDLVLALSCLALSLPLMLVCAVFIKLSSPGPIVIRQTRLGKNGKLFSMYKLRTMYRHAERQSGPVLAAENDSRVVPTCRWMRRGHVDELPQLINVLRGEMSMVGPRPERPEIAEQIHETLPEFRQRLQVRPGITGLAQVCNGYDTCEQAVKLKLEYDLRYIRQRGWLMELLIWVRTVPKVYDSAAR